MLKNLLKLSFISICIFTAKTHAQRLAVGGEYGLTLYSQFASVSFHTLLADKHELGISLGVNIPYPSRNSQSYVFSQSLHPRTAGEYLRFGLSYNYFLVKKWTKFKPYVFGNVFFTYAHNLSVMYNQSSDSTDSEGFPAYIEGVAYPATVDKVYFGPYIWMDFHIGVGFEINLTKQLFLNQRLGAGIGIVHGDEHYLITDTKINWGFGFLASVGLKYRFSNNKKPPLP